MGGAAVGDVVELDSRTISIGKVKSQTEVSGAVVVVLALHTRAQVNAGAPSAGSNLGGGVPVGVDTVPGDGGATPGHTHDETSPGKIPRVSLAAISDSSGRCSIKLCNTVSKTCLTLWNSSIAIDDEAVRNSS